MNKHSVSEYEERLRLATTTADVDRIVTGCKTACERAGTWHTWVQVRPIVQATNKRLNGIGSPSVWTNTLPTGRCDMSVNNSYGRLGARRFHIKELEQDGWICAS